MLTGSLQVKGGKYYAVLNYYESGKRKVKWISTGLSVRGNKRAAEEILTEMRIKYDGVLGNPKGKESSILFADYLRNWLQSTKASIAIATYDSYSQLLNSRIDEYFRKLNVKLCDVTPTQIQGLYTEILADGCVTNTVIRYHALIHRALKSAVKKELIDSNPADRIDKPKKNTFKAGFYSSEEVGLLFDAAVGDPCELPIVLSAYYGLRRSEALGLKWESIDFDSKTISINHKIIETYENGKAVTIGEDVLKTKSSIRTLPLIPYVEQKLREQSALVEERKRLFKKSYSHDASVYVCTDEMGTLIRPNYLTGHFKWLLEKNELRRIRFHDLRHTCASLLLANGVSMKQIQLWLGHSNFSTTADIYSHLDFSAQVSSAETISNVLGRIREDAAAADAEEATMELEPTL